MPELADVEGFRGLLDRRARGARITGVEVADAGVLRELSPGRLRQAALGARFGRPSRHGKWLLAPLENGGEATLAFHFGMTGSLEWSPGPARGERHRHDRVTFVLDRGELAFRDQRKLRGIWLASDAGELARLLGDLGPDALGLDEATLVERVGPHHKALKAALMDQRIVAGIGNLTADEVLWRACLHPERRPDRLEGAEWSRLAAACRQVLADSARRGHLPVEGGWLTGVRDEPDPACPRCATPLCRGRSAGRGTRWCPSCQPAGR